MKWDILCLTMRSRTEFLKRLQGNILTQLEWVSKKMARHDVRFSMMVHDPDLSLGANRQLMREESDAEYVCFIDDDDLLADDYVALKEVNSLELGLTGQKAGIGTFLTSTQSKGNLP